MASLSLQVFVISVVILIFGLSVLSWSHAVNLKLLEPISLKEIELRHPHIPSLKVIIVIFLCSIALLIVALHAVNGESLLQGPYQSLYFAALFALGATVGILAELRWEGAKQYAFAFIAGTSIALLSIVVYFTFPHDDQVVLMLILLLLLIACLFLAWHVLYTSWTRNVRGLSIATFILWIFLFLY